MDQRIYQRTYIANPGYKPAGVHCVDADFALVEGEYLQDYRTLWYLLTGNGIRWK